MSFIRKLGNTLGSAVEWCDFALYGFLGPIISTVFLSPYRHDDFINLLITYAIFAIGFSARPIGAALFGYLGDKYGRMFSLKITPVLISLCSILIAILPTYQTAGYLSIILLLLIRKRSAKYPLHNPN